MTDTKKVNFAAGSKNGPGADETDADKRRRLAELETKVRHHKECERKAQVIVERLLDNPISEEFLVGAAQFLHVSQYVDVTEERAITRLCGYPLCSKPLPKQPKKKYHISLRDKKVYDITDRKNFCSNQCYKSSKHFENQVSTTAVWARQKEAPVNFILLPLNAEMNRGQAGEEVVTDPTAKIRLELETLDERDRRLAQTLNDALMDNKLASKIPNRPTGADSDVQEVGLNELANQVSEILLIDKSDDGVNDAQPSSSSDRAIIKGQPDSEEVGNVVATPQASTSEESELRTNPPCQPVTPAGSDNTTQKVLTNPEVPPHETNRADCVPLTEQKLNTMSEASSSKAQELMDLLDRRDQLRELSDQPAGEAKRTASSQSGQVSGLQSGQVSGLQSGQETASTSGHKGTAAGPKPVQAKISETVQPPAEKPSERVVKVSSSSVIDNIRRVSAQQKGPKQGRSKKAKKSQQVSPLVPIRDVLLEWKTPETVSFLRRPAEADEEAGLSDFDKKYAQLGRRVQAADLSDVLGEEALGEDNPTTQPLPDFKELKRDTVQLELKVREFYRGNTRFPVVLPDEPADQTAEPGQQDSKQLKGEDSNEREPFMPFVDSHSQTGMRRKIVLDKLDRAVPDLLSPLRLPVQEVAGELRELVYTFRLTATNIVLKTHEWTLMALFLLRLLAIKKPSIDAALRGLQATTTLRPILQGLGITDSMVDEVVQQMISRDKD